MKTQALLSLAYLPPVAYFNKLIAYSTIWIDAHEHYIKQTYRNRCIIGGAGGLLPLTIPTEKTEALKCNIREVRISEHGNWRHVHRNAFVAAYGQTPFFEYYADEFLSLIDSGEKNLFSFNLELMKWVCEQIDIEPKWRFTTEYIRPEQLPADIDDWRDHIHPKINFRETDFLFEAKPYYQIFRDKYGFLPNLSIVDLLFNMGPESILVLQDSIKKIGWQE